jgi:short-subunit dehydrogenase
MKIDGCNALITGASAGIGRELARQLAGRARSLVLVARRRERLEELRDELSNPDLKVYVRVVDLADQTQIEQLLDSLERDKIDIDLLINNAGLGDLGPFNTSDPARINQILQVNVAALTLLTRRLLPPMIARKRGAILNVSSSAGFLPIGDFSVYAASKAYVNSFSEGLRAELRGTGVTVTALCPGPVHTEFMQVAQRSDIPSYKSGPKFVYVSVEQVARNGLAAVEADRPLLIPGFVMKLAMFLVRLTPLALLRWTNLSAKRARGAP